MKKLLYIVSLVLFGFATTVSADSGVEHVRVAQFGKAKFLLYLPLYVAMEEGFFDKQGLAIDLSFAGNDDQVFATLISGSADFAVGDPVFTAIAAESGFEAKTVALLIRKAAIFGYANAGGPVEVRGVQDLAGLRIGSFPAPSTTYTLLSDLSSQLPSEKRLRIVEGAVGTQLAMLQARQVDIAVDLEPAVSIVEAQGKRVILDLAKLTNSQAFTGLMTTQKQIGSRPEIVSKMVRAIAEALAVISSDRASAYHTASKLFPEVEPSILKRAVDRTIDSGCYPVSPIVPDEDWQRTLQTRIRSGELKAGQSTDRAVNNQFARASATSLSQ